MANVQEILVRFFFFLAFLGGLVAAGPVGTVSSDGHLDNTSSISVNSTSLPLKITLWHSAVSAASPAVSPFSTLDTRLASVAYVLLPHFRTMPMSPKSLTSNIPVLRTKPRRLEDCPVVCSMDYDETERPRVEGTWRMANLRQRRFQHLQLRMWVRLCLVFRQA
jgi:hypothetical protein